MTRNKSSALFFSAVRKMARLQRTAWRLAPHALFKEVMRQSSASASQASAKAARKRASVDKAAAGAGPEFDAAAFAGTWKTRVYRTPPVPGVWPVRLSYFVYAPPRLRKGCPVLVMLHGCEQTARDFAVGTRMHRVADREGLLLVYPQQSRRGQHNRCWHWYQPDSAHGYAEADAIAGIAAAAVADYQADPARVYIAGLSAGAGMAALTALRHPDLFAAVGMHSGAALGGAHNAGQGLRVMRHGAEATPDQAMASLMVDRETFPGMPAIILQGDDDVVVDKRNGHQLFEQMAWVNGMDAGGDDAAPSQEKDAGSARRYLRMDAPSRRGPVVSLCEVPGLGHAWSGGDGRIRFHSRQGPNASLLMWRFFKGRKRAG
ncbi:MULTISPECIES: extracellular catalytic domain type 1 short-chain-length polyhydroxyalkanoate depolymerase [Alcaligenaceae]|uniref:extracellular catalytic domain type 1 short-chain-length polyhydroxyalkanoate depolymerase n=1 Tax=Bordetella genomosp. 10 TaxID=1416804 RepID=UPI0011789E22|nr:PHB depolymerase family esterase [Bordetella genomosp. 10]